MTKDTSHKIPDNLLREIHRGNCIPLIGSGVASEADVGIPGASELARELVKEIEDMDSAYYHFDDHQNDPLDKV